MLAPMLALIGWLFFGGLGYGLLQSLGWNPRIGNRDISLDAYYSVLFSDQHAEIFWRGLLLNLWVSILSTFGAAVLALGSALLLRQTFPGKKLATFLFQLNLPVPHVVAAIGILFVFSQSGLIARGAVQLGLMDVPKEFPVLVRDSWGIGIIISYIWKEMPFFGVIALSILQSLGQDYEDRARILGANSWQRFRYVIVPLVLPGMLSASVIVFAFTFGAYEVPAILGERFPRMLPVTAVKFFMDPDLNARAEGMAIGIIIAIIAFALVVFYMWIGRKTIRNN